MTTDQEGQTEQIQFDKLSAEVAKRRSVQAAPKRKRTNPARTMLLAALLALVVVLALMAVIGSRKAPEGASLALHVVKRGPLTISLQQTGTLEAIKYIPIASQLQRRLQISMLVPEGEEVEKGQVLVELDGSGLEDEFDSAELSLVDAKSDLFQARTNYQVQLKVNETDLNQALLAAELAAMDVHKYLGDLSIDEFTSEQIQWARGEIAAEQKRLQELADSTANGVAASGMARPEAEKPEGETVTPAGDTDGTEGAGGEASDTADSLADGEDVAAAIDASVTRVADAAVESVRRFMAETGDMTLRVKLCELRLTGYLEQYTDISRLDEMADFDPDAEIANITRSGEMELAIREQLVARNQAYKNYTDFQRLYKDGFITRQDRDLADNHIKFISAQLKLKNLLQYVIPKTLRQNLSDYHKAVVTLEKTLITTSAERERKLDSVEQRRTRLLARQDKYDELKEWLTQTKLTAPVAGIVTYGDPKDTHRFWRRGQIAVGQHAYAGNVLMTIPDLSSLRLTCNVHEADISSIKVGQTVNVTPSGFPNMHLPGKINKVANVANTGNPFAASDVKEFTVEIVLEATSPELKPGMSAKADILVRELENVLSVPKPSIFSKEGVNFCYVKTDSVLIKQPVIMGLSCEAGVEITAGLEEGEKILLSRPPIGAKIIPSERHVTEPVMEVQPTTQAEKSDDEETDEDEDESGIPPETRKKLNALVKKIADTALSREERMKVIQEMGELTKTLTPEQQQQLRQEMQQERMKSMSTQGSGSGEAGGGRPPGMGRGAGGGRPRSGGGPGR